MAEKTSIFRHKLTLTLKYYHGELSVDYILVSYSEQVSYKSVDLAQYPELREVTSNVRKRDAE